jgi:lipocalin
MRFIAPSKPIGHYMNVARVVMFVIMGLGILVAVKAQNVIDISVFMLGLSSSEITANWGQWWWWRFNGKARLAASIGGPVIFLVNKFIIFKYLVITQQADYLVVFSSIGATTVLWILVALLTKPDPEEKLVEFYLRARPLGWWGPIALKATGEVPVYRRRPIFAGLGLALAGTVMVAAGTVAISCVYIARWWTGCAAAVVCIGVGLYFKKRYTKFIDYMETQCEDKSEATKDVNRPELIS